jgi:hypothetical protein
MSAYFNVRRPRGMVNRISKTTNDQTEYIPKMLENTVFTNAPRMKPSPKFISNITCSNKEYGDGYEFSASVGD